MSQARVWVRPARTDQADLHLHGEHASARPELLGPLGLDVGRQVIVRRDADRFALYTLTDAGPEPPGGPGGTGGPGDTVDTVDTVRMGDVGRARLDGPVQFDADLDGLAVDPAATLEEALRGEKLLELLHDGGRDGLLVLAPHGGGIEPHTDSQAERVGALLADLDVSCWRCRGWNRDGSPVARWHITSRDISAASFPRLGIVSGRGFRHAVSFHGFATDPDRPEVLIGGAAPDALRRVVRAVVASAVEGTGLRVAVAGPHDPLGGSEEANIVNRLTAGGRGGVQIEQQPRARTVPVPGSDLRGWEAIAAAVAALYRVILTEGGAVTPR